MCWFMSTLNISGINRHRLPYFHIPRCHTDTVDPKHNTSDPKIQFSRFQIKKKKTMNREKQRAAAVILVVLVRLVQCQVNPNSSYNGNGTSVPYSRRLSELTFALVNSQISERAKFCVTNPTAEWNQAFNYTPNTDFLTSCAQKTNGDFLQRLCTSPEINFYFRNLFDETDYLKPNKNCNITSSWVSGCEPGWACSTGPDIPKDIKGYPDIPSRTSNCQPCCEGFFCPHGLTCMIPCPLGSYCPTATLNTTNGICEPYTYQLSPANPNHTCGGANIWADVGNSPEIFCKPGSYCPTVTQNISCSSGHYCRLGSISEKRCFKLTSCDSNTTHQNIQAYGMMLIVALTVLLLTLYNCSDKIITTREKRYAKSREAAARGERERAKARERWKAAMEATKKYAARSQTQLSYTFSCGFTIPRADDELRILSSGRSAPKNGDTDATIDIIEEDLNYTGENIHSETEDGKNGKKKTAKRERIHTRSQIFKYAYAQLEKEKVLQQQAKNLSFSEVVSMAVKVEIRKRPTIEIEFRDLTLTLKDKNKHLLRCVSGKIMPGRVTAVMGPSGAGKTTFLSALAGKVVGCKMSGVILVNGKSDSIHSYKRIIGFVPQDDVVHGNLTVEENIWFSARCRLPADMKKPDRVLIVERVIESLGLQAVRSSLVGTVEKRGISGGQRKRVNVGLEMVMGPSLLILDEPTSGLDSSSSQLLLRALRRETLEGVNVCMVVHQPSYSLFQMFDDLILLAKGGLTAYHGSVKKVEEYFAGLGINVPERVNPPDHFIDFLEGMVNPSTSSGVNHEELPLLWMLHKGYAVPPDMKRESGELVMFPARVVVTDEEETVAEEIWHDVKKRRDILRLNFLSSGDLSNRRTPGILLQYKIFLGRIGKQRLREARVQGIDYLILLLAGACLGSVTKSSEQTFGAPGYTYTIIAVSLLCKIAALRSFSQDKLQYWRESSSGISSLAHFLSKDTIDHFNTMIKPTVYLSMFYFFSQPRSSFTENYIVLLSLVYCVTGIGYMLAIFLESGPSQLFSVLLPVVLTLIATQTGDSTFMKHLSQLCYPKWALEAFVISNAKRYYGVWLITRCGVLKKFGYDVHDWYHCIIVLLLNGVVSRILAFIGMLIFQKK